MTGIVSIHDVMPRTLPKVRELLEWLGGHGVKPVTLLVVPGAEWSEAEMDELRRWEEAGCELAGHGWRHETRPQGVYHRLHAALISRHVAEHLALDGPGIAELIRTCFGWFAEHGFSDPQLYVPPAWAMGAISRREVSRLPFARYEYMGGVLDGESGEFHKVPMVGFEADRWWRKAAVSAWNRWNLRRARRGEGRLRIGIHPHDRSLLLAGDLEEILRDCEGFGGYGPGQPAA